MAHEPQHRDNPYRPDLAEAERVPAKIWELLRRNDCFKKAVERLSVLDGRVRDVTKEITRLRASGVTLDAGSPDSEQLSVKCRERSEAKFLASRVLENIGKVHSFAAAALQWLVPEPWFEIRHEVIADGVDLTGKQWVPTKAIRIEGGETPEPNDWQTFTAHGEFDAESRRNHAGCAPMVRGPCITFTVPDDPRLQGDKVNGIQEWRDYHSSHGQFTLADSWRNTPPGFKRTFCYLWRQRDSREQNPLTACRTDAPQEHETSFFNGWSLGACFTKNSFQEEDLARVLIFNDLADNYRVFAFPKSIRSRMEARRMADWLVEQLAAGLPAREPDVWGSSLQWDVLLTVQDLMRAGAPFDEALQESFERIHLQADKWQEGQPMPDQKKGWAQRGADWQNTYRVMDAPLSGDGFVQRIFPSKPTDS